MKSHIKNVVMRNLANAPKIVAIKTIDDLPTTADKDEAKRLFKALGVNLPTTADKDEEGTHND